MVAACRNAALLALEEANRLVDADGSGNNNNGGTGPSIQMRHLLQSLKSAERQITPEMLDFYASFQQKGQRQQGGDR